MRIIKRGLSIILWTLFTFCYAVVVAITWFITMIIGWVGSTCLACIDEDTNVFTEFIDYLKEVIHDLDIILGSKN